jgi:hypothetical protein
MSWQILTRQDPDLLPESDSIDMSLQNFNLVIFLGISTTFLNLSVISWLLISNINWD